MNVRKYQIILIPACFIFAIAAYLFFQINNTWKYSDFVYKYAKRHDVDPLLIKAIIKAESDFSPNAVSNKGAVGLMQIMPSTAKQIAKYMKIKNFNREMLYNPEINIMVGIYYYKILYTMFNGNKNLVLASYNAGLGNVSQWRKMNPIVEYDSEQMPFDETKKYVRKIGRIYSILKIADKIVNLKF